MRFLAPHTQSWHAGQRLQRPPEAVALRWTLCLLSSAAHTWTQSHVTKRVQRGREREARQRARLCSKSKCRKRRVVCTIRAPGAAHQCASASPSVSLPGTPRLQTCQPHPHPSNFTSHPPNFTPHPSPLTRSDGPSGWWQACSEAHLHSFSRWTAWKRQGAYITGCLLAYGSTRRQE